MARLWLCVILVAALGATAVAWLIAQPLAARAYSGLEFAEMTEASAARAPMMTAHGALVASVDENSPAARALIRPGAVVAAIDGVNIQSARQAARIMRRHPAGDRTILTVFDETRGAIKPRNVALIFDVAPPVSKSIFTVAPPRVLAKELFNPPPTAANASWSRRLAHGASVRPRLLPQLNAGTCSGVAPEEWRVADGGEGLIHLTSKDGGEHAIYKLVPLGAAQHGDPKGYVLGLLHGIFHSPVSATPTEPRGFGVSSFSFGNQAGAAGFALYRLNGDMLSVWLAAAPAGDISWALPVTGAALLSLDCQSKMAPAPSPRVPALVATEISTHCLNGQCGDSDFAASYLEKFRLGFVHARDGEVFLVNPRRDFWLSGQEGPGFYRQVGGENEKLEPGRTN